MTVNSSAANTRPELREDCRSPEELLRLRESRGLLAPLKRKVRSLLSKLVRDPAPTFLSFRENLSDYDIGQWTFGHLEVRSWAKGGSLKIGKFCGISHGVTVYLGGEHRIDWITAYPFPSLFGVQEKFPGYPRIKGDVVIGNDVWIGENAIIMSGVEIGDGAVIGAGCVVRRDVPPYAICAGNPGRVSGFRFEKEQIQALRKVAWWDWEIDKIKEAWPLLLSQDLEPFLEKYGEVPASPPIAKQEDKEAGAEGSPQG
jgi:acetyltransferase-like isoleucine patch superfamily enzyme